MHPQVLDVVGYPVGQRPQARIAVSIADQLRLVLSDLSAHRRQVQIDCLPKTDQFVPFTSLVAVQANPFFLLVKKTEVSLSRQGPNEALMIHRRGIDEVADDLLP